jgi:hypothetical protein
MLRLGSLFFFFPKKCQKGETLFLKMKYSVTNLLFLKLFWLPETDRKLFFLGRMVLPHLCLLDIQFQEFLEIMSLPVKLNSA